jgi:hypothetical protein
MTGRRAALALVALAVLGPVVALGASQTFADDPLHRVDALWVYGTLWALVCLIGAWTQWRRA